MTIEEYKRKLDEYLGMTGELKLIDDSKASITYAIAYLAPTGVPLVTYRIVRSKIHDMPHGWYESGSRSDYLPYLDPDKKLQHELWEIKRKELNGE